MSDRRRRLEAGWLSWLFDERTDKALEKRATVLTAEGYAVRDSRGSTFSPAGYAKLKERRVALSIQDQLETTKPLIGVARAQVTGFAIGAELELAPGANGRIQAGLDVKRGLNGNDGKSKSRSGA